MTMQTPWTANLAGYMNEIARVVRCYQAGASRSPLPVRTRANELSPYEVLLLR